MITKDKISYVFIPGDGFLKKDVYENFLHVPDSIVEVELGTYQYISDMTTRFGPAIILDQQYPAEQYPTIEEITLCSDSTFYWKRYRQDPDVYTLGSGTWSYLNNNTIIFEQAIDSRYLTCTLVRETLKIEDNKTLFSPLWITKDGEYKCAVYRKME